MHERELCMTTRLQLAERDDRRLVLVSRLSDGWNTTGLIATFGDGSHEAIVAPTPEELLAKLDAAGVARRYISLCGPEDGDHGLSAEVRSKFSILLWRTASAREECRDDRVLIARDTDGWNTLGVFALVDGETIHAATPAELLAKLDAAGIARERIVACGPDDGDFGLSAKTNDELSMLLRTSGT